MAGCYDFDKARAERLSAPAPSMVVFGETVELPRSVPAAIHLEAASRKDEKITFAFLAEMLGLLVTPARVERWVTEHNIEEDDLRDLYYGAIGVINEVEPDPEAEPPETGDQGGETSSPTGVQSSPTSNAST